MRYNLKDKYKDTSICPNGKVVILKDLSQKQIELLVSAGYEHFFTKVDKKPSKKNKVSK
jgi:hypothetical protein